MSEVVSVRVVGVGVNKTITIEDNSPIQAALDEARVAAADSGLQVRVNGEAVDPTSFVPQNGDTVVVVPPQVKLGA